MRGLGQGARVLQEGDGVTDFFEDSDDLGLLDLAAWDDEPVDALALRATSKRRRLYNIREGTIHLARVLGGLLPGPDEVVKLISFNGGFASINFIDYIAQTEGILELTASTLRVGRRQMDRMLALHRQGKLERATFFIGALMATDELKGKDSYNYFKHALDLCDEVGWRYCVTNNHSKVLLMRTPARWYVLETSSNLNENPKIEQYSLEQSEELYRFYAEFFQRLMLITEDKHGRW